MCHGPGACGGELGDRLEQDRAFGQATLRDAGMHTLAMHAFHDFDAADAFIAKYPRRYVLKWNGSDFPSDANYVGRRQDGGDVVAALERHRRLNEDPDFTLMDHITGLETGLGAFCNGREFVGPINLD